MNQLFSSQMLLCRYWITNDARLHALANIDFYVYVTDFHMELC